MRAAIILICFQLISNVAISQRLIDKAYEEYNRYDHQKVIEYCQRALKKDPNEARAYVLLASIRNDSSDYSEGLRLVEKAFALNGNLPGAFFVRGEAKHG